MVVIKPKNGQVLIEQERNLNKEVFSESDARKDLAYGVVEALTPDYVGSDGVKSTLKIGDRIIYNPRSLTPITVNNTLKGMLHERDIKALADAS
jgi:co-chaperonin GroES (HSP10)